MTTNDLHQLIHNACNGSTQNISIDFFPEVQSPFPTFVLIVEDTKSSIYIEDRGKDSAMIEIHNRPNEPVAFVTASAERVIKSALDAFAIEST